MPLDPAGVSPEERGEESVVLEMEHEDAIEHVRSVFADVGFGFPVEFSPSTLLNERVDAGVDPYYVLGACNPEMAARALAETKAIGALFPCGVVVWQEEPGRQRVYHVSIMRIARLVDIAPDDDAWAEIVADTGEMVDEAFERLAD